MENRNIEGKIILDKLNWRYAVKKFDSNKKISEENWNVLEESLRLAPSSYGTQPWKFLVIQSQEVRKKLTPLSWNQTQIEDCSHLVVLAVKFKMDEAHLQKYIERMAEVRKVDPAQLSGFKKVLVDDLVKGPRSLDEANRAWAQRQAYIAMGFLLETAALMNIDTCPLEGLDPKAYDQVLKLEGTGFETVAAVAAGYRHSDDKYQTLPKVRFEKKDVISYV